MFSYLSRGYGTWEGIAKLEKPDSAISPNPGNYSIFPPIRRDQYQFYDRHFDHDRSCRLQEDFKLPQVPKNAVHLPKTYSTKRGALLLYSEGCFKPGSRRLKKRQRHRRQKIELRIRTMKDLIDLIMDYKKNGCDPLLLEQLWRHMSGNARDVQPGYSPKRYLGHLSHTFDPEQWKRLVETGSLKSFGTADDGYLSFLPDYDHHLNRQPPPYKTMSLPPVSPSSSMLGSFTFYKHALSTGAASMVSLPSMGSENVDSINADHISVKSAATFAESLADRLAEVESEDGFKKDYETLTSKEKEDLLTQLLMDVTLHNQGEVITVPVHTKEITEDQACASTDISYISDTKPSKSLESLQSYNSVQTLPPDEKRSRSRQTKSSSSMKSIPTGRMQMSDERSESSKPGKRSRSSKSDIRSKSSVSVPSRNESVCSLPPIMVPRTGTPDKDDLKNVSNNVSLSSSHSGLGLVVADFEVGLNDVDIEVGDSLFHLAEDTVFHHEGRDLKRGSIKSNESFSEHSLVNALSIQDGDSVHQFTDETRSLKSLGSTKGPVHRTDGMDERLRNDGAVVPSKTVDGELVNGMVDGAIGDGYCVTSGDDGSRYSDDINDGAGHDIGSDGEDDGIAIVINGGGDGTRDSDGYNVNEGDGPSICISEARNPDAVGHPEATLPDPALAPELQAPHLSLSSLQDEVRLVATQVLSRPKSGRTLTEDAEMATFLLLERMQGLLGPALTENTRVSSAAPRKVRPLGQPRNSETKERRRVRSAEATLASRNIIEPEEKQVEPVSPVPKTEEKPAEQVSGEERERSVEGDRVSKTDAKDLNVDDVIVTVETVQDTAPGGKNEPQSLASATPSPERTALIVDDLQSEVKQEVTTKPEEVKAEETTVKKGGKLKKTGNGKRVTKVKKKRPSNARARNEPPKTPPFHAGLVPESKPPKGLEEKAGGGRKKGKQASPDLQEITQPKTTDKVSEIETHPPETSPRVDSETGEVKHGVSPARSEKSPSLAGSNALSGGRKSVSRQDQISRAQSSSPRSQIGSPRENSPSEKMSSSREKTPSPREKLPSPSDQKACPRDRDAVFNETTNANRENAITEPEPSPTREPSPKIVLTEKERRANARAAQRAAAAERRRQEVERKRREREEARKRAQEEEARLDILRKESEEEMKKREEERRIQKEQEERERARQEAEQNERARQERLTNERQRQAREEWKRKKEQLIAQRKFEEELRQERERVEMEIEEERRREYAEKIAHLEEEEQERLMEERRLEEERIKREIQEEKERREAERLQMLEERRLMEEELAAARMRQMERRSFLETLLRDFQNLLLDQRITRAFTFSYFDIMPWFKERWRDLEEDRPRSKRPSTKLDTVPEESEMDLEQAV